MRSLYTLASLFILSSAALGQGSTPIVDESVVFAEKDGRIAVEAEHFFKQTLADKRAFHLVTTEKAPHVKPDGDPPHAAGASGGAYLEILPDTRRTHGDKLIHGTNFSPQPGKMAVVSYKVHISTPGRYFVWVRAWSTGSEDNGLHVGIDGTWPETGQRLQWCAGKHSWRWESKQRTQQQHCGEPFKIYLDIEKAGEHVIHFSMREDGFEFDKWVMTKDRDLGRPEGLGSKSTLHAGQLPKPFRFVALKDTPTNKPARQAALKALPMSAAMFAEAQLKGYYLDQGKWLAVNPAQHDRGSVSRTFPYPTGVYDVTLRAVGESDGQSTYNVRVGDQPLGSFKCPLSTQMYEEGAKFSKTWKTITITEGTMINVASQTASADGKEHSRARWAGIAFRPANTATAKAAAPLLRRMARQEPKHNQFPKTSPTKSISSLPLIQPRNPDGDGSTDVSGELRTWHKVTLTMNGPYAHEQDNAPNPFTDYRMTTVFTHSDGTRYVLPGYFAADGNAAHSSADSGTKWRVHFAPDRPGTWKYQISFAKGKLAAFSPDAGDKVTPFEGTSGSVHIQKTNKSGRDLRAEGRLQYVGQHYLRFAGSGRYFLKVGADAPETLLAYTDFDNTIARLPKKAPLKTWGPHVTDWKDGDPLWKDGKGKGLIGAINYLSAKGCNAFSFLTYNAGGDGDNVWPFIQRDDKLHYDCSKLDQWGIVFDHGTHRGMYLHFKMQETENDDHKRGNNKKLVPECLDGGELGVQRKLYCRELIARFGHNLALNWNLGEENTQTHAQQQAMIDYIADLDAYDHNIVVHTYPEQQDLVYKPKLGAKSKLTGLSLQNSSIRDTHSQTLKWVTASSRANRPWVVAFDESGTAAHGQCPDLGYKGFDGKDRNGKTIYTEHEVRKQTLWGTLMAGGAGCEYYFGYQFVENDIVCQDWRSRDRSWDYCRIAIQFFRENNIPFWEMTNQNRLVGNEKNDNSKYCFAKASDTYLVYFPNGGTSSLDLGAATGSYTVRWFNPRTGGPLLPGTVPTIVGGKSANLGTPPADHKNDWLAVVRRNKP